MFIKRPIEFITKPTAIVKPKIPKMIPIAFADSQNFISRIGQRLSPKSPVINRETGFIIPSVAKNSPVKRIDDNGNATTNGRQIDCYIEEAKEVYELKMRVTIAASGQGRFSEEMSFPYEAQKAGLIPILVVFDNNESALLTKLKNRYIECNGKCYIGNDAWKILQERAGHEMGIFINKYIYPPINSMEQCLQSNPHEITLSKQESQIVISNTTNRYTIDREI